MDDILINDFKKQNSSIPINGKTFYHGEEVSGLYPYVVNISKYSYFGSRKCLGDKKNRYTYYGNQEPYCSSLPAGLNLNSETGEISGTVTEPKNSKSFKSYIFAEKGLVGEILTRTKKLFDASAGSIIELDVGLNSNNVLKSKIAWAKDNKTGREIDQVDWRYLRSSMVGTLKSDVKDFLCFDYYKEGEEYYDYHDAALGLNPITEKYSFYNGGIVALGLDGNVTCIGFDIANKVSNSIKLIDGLSGVKEIKKHGEFSVIAIMNSGGVKIFGGYFTEYSSGGRSVGGGSYASCTAQKPPECPCCWSISRTDYWPWGTGNCRCPDSAVVWTRYGSRTVTVDYLNYVYDKHSVMAIPSSLNNVAEVFSPSDESIIAIRNNGSYVSWGSGSNTLNPNLNLSGFLSSIPQNDPLKALYKVKNILIGISTQGKIITNDSELGFYARCLNNDLIAVTESYESDLGVVILQLSNGYSLIYPSLAGYAGSYGGGVNNSTDQLSATCFARMVEKFKQEASANQSFSLPSASVGGLPPFLLDFKVLDVHIDLYGVVLICDGAGVKRYYRCEEPDLDAIATSAGDVFIFPCKVEVGPAKIDPSSPFLETSSAQPSLEGGEAFEFTLREISDPYNCRNGDWVINSGPAWIKIENPRPVYSLYSYADSNQVKIKGVADGLSNQVINLTISPKNFPQINYSLSFIIKNGKPKFDTPQGKDSYTFTGVYNGQVNSSVSVLSPEELSSFRLLTEIPAGLSFNEQTGNFTGTFLCNLGINKVSIEAINTNQKTSRTTVFFNVLPGAPVLVPGEWRVELSFPSYFDLNTLVQNQNFGGVESWDFVGCDRLESEYEIRISGEGDFSAVFHGDGSFTFDIDATDYSGNVQSIVLMAEVSSSFPPVSFNNLGTAHSLTCNTSFELPFDQAVPDYAVLSISGLPIGLLASSSKIYGAPKAEGSFVSTYRLAKKVVDIDVSNKGLVGAVLYGGIPLCWSVADRNLSVPPQSATGLISIVSCDSGFLGLKTDGTLVSWSSSGLRAPEELSVPNLNNVVQIFGNGKSMLGALTSSGDINYWTIGSGDNPKSIATTNDPAKMAYFSEHYIVALTQRGLKVIDVSYTFSNNLNLSTEPGYIIYDQDKLDQYVGFSVGLYEVYVTTNTGKIKGFQFNRGTVLPIRNFGYDIYNQDIVGCVGIFSSFLFSTVENYILPYGDNYFLPSDLSLNSRPKKLAAQFRTHLSSAYLSRFPELDKKAGFLLCENGDLIPINGAFVPDEVLFPNTVNGSSFVVSCPSVIPEGISNNQWLSISEDGSCIAKLDNIFTNDNSKNKISVFMLNSNGEWDGKKSDTSSRIRFNSSLSLNKDGTIISVGGNK